MSHGTTARSEITKAEFAFVLLAGVGVAFGLSWAGSMWSSLSLCLLCMAYFAVRRFRQAEAQKDSDSLEMFADQVYMLGYMLTISAIAGVVLQSQAQTPDLLKAGAVKLTTTIVGLVVMFIFKEFAHGWNQERERAGQQADAHVNAELRAAVRGLISEAESLRENVGGLVAAFDPETIHKMAVFADEFSDLMRGTAGALPPLKAALEQTAGGLASFQPRVEGAGRGLEVFNTALSAARSEGVVPLGVELQALVSRAVAGEGALGRLSSAGEGLGGALDRLAKSFETEKERLAEVRDGFRRLMKSYESLEQRVQNILRLHETDATAPLSQLAKSVHESAEKLDALTRQLGAAAGEISLLRGLGLAETAKNLVQAASALDGNTARQTEVSSSLHSASESLAQVTKQLGEMRGTLANLTVQLERISARPSPDQQPASQGLFHKIFGKGGQ